MIYLKQRWEVIPVEHNLSLCIVDTVVESIWQTTRLRGRSVDYVGFLPAERIIGDGFSFVNQRKLSRKQF